MESIEFECKHIQKVKNRNYEIVCNSCGLVLDEEYIVAEISSDRSIEQAYYIKDEDEKKRFKLLLMKIKSQLEAHQKIIERAYYIFEKFYNKKEIIINNNILLATSILIAYREHKIFVKIDDIVDVFVKNFCRIKKRDLLRQIQKIEINTQTKYYKNSSKIQTFLTKYISDIVDEIHFDTSYLYDNIETIKHKTLLESKKIIEKINKKIGSRNTSSLSASIIYLVLKDILNLKISQKKVSEITNTKEYTIRTHYKFLKENL